VSHEDERPDGAREELELEAAAGRGEGEHDDLLAALAAAMRPADLAEDVHERILARALGAEAQEVAASSEEQRSADALRSGLEAGDPRHPLVALALALRLAARPREVPELVQSRLVRDALRAPRKVVVVRTVAVVGIVLSAAAVLLMWVTRPALTPTEASLPEPPPFLPGMVETRSTTSLFTPEDFPREGGQSSRIDRIASERSADLRTNRFVAWGVP
jgi:hypothetical protein